MEDHYLKVQKYFMRKNQEVELTYLSWTTDEDLAKIQGICSDIEDILRSADIPTKKSSGLGSNLRAIGFYKFLVLNTNFEVSNKFLEDPVNGHLADMFPSLSKSLLVQILFSLEYEPILSDSVLHFPLSLSLELLEISRRFLEKLQPKRRLDFVLSLILNVYRKFLNWRSRTLDTEDPEHDLERCLTKFQEVLLLLLDPKAMGLADLPLNKQFENMGIIFQRVLRSTQACLELEDRCDTDEDMDRLLGDAYKMHLGRKQQQLDSNVVENFLEKCKDDLMVLVEKLTQGITMEMYISWVEFDDPERKCSLQFSVRNECFLFIRFLRTREKQVEKFQDLVKCLQPISLPEDETLPSLEQLVERFRDQQEHSLLELLKNYREFDEEVFEVIREGSKDYVYDERECDYLLAFLALVLGKPEVGVDFKKKVLEFVGKALFSLSFDVYVKVCVESILKNNSLQDGDPLDPEHLQRDLEEYLCLNTNFNADNLRVIYFWMLRDPHGVLKLLLKMLMGHRDFDEVMIVPEEFLHHFSPILGLRVTDSETMLTRNLRELCAEDFPWNTQKLAGFLDILSRETRVSLVHRVLLPYLQLENPNLSNFGFVLTLLRGWLTPTLLCQLRKEDLVVTLQQASSSLRSRVRTSKSEAQECLIAIHRILDSIFGGYDLDEKVQERVTARLELNEHRIEPIDWLFYTRRLSDERNSPERSLQVFKVYESKCFAVLSRFQEGRSTSRNPGEQYLRNFTFLREDFLKHLFLRMTHKEFEKFGLEYVHHDYYHFNWTSRAQALENFLRIVFELALVLLQFPESFPEDAFPFLLALLVNFVRSFVQNNANFKLLQALLDILASRLLEIRATVESTGYSDIYEVLVVQVPVEARGVTLEDTRSMLKDLVDEVGHFAYRCYEAPRPRLQFTGKPSRKSLSHFLAYRLICEFLKVPRADKSEFRVRVERLFAEFSGIL